jgi:hypothetical protein
MVQRSTVSTRLALIFLAAVFSVLVYQAATRPVLTGEAYLYDRFVRPTVRQVLAEERPNRDVLYTLLEKRSVGLFRVSPFSIRLPGLLFAILYLWAGWRFARLLPGAGRGFLPAVVLMGCVPLVWHGFVRADGTAAALALELCGILLAVEYLVQNQPAKLWNLNLSGACLGLAVAARLEFAAISAVPGLLILAASAFRRQAAVSADRVLVPALVVAWMFLPLPLSHAHAAESAPEITADQAGRVRSCLRVLRERAGSNRIRVGASPSIEPVVNFYRAQHRITAWERAVRDLPAGQVDYYLLTGAGGGLVEQRHLIVLYRDGEILLARSSPAAM